jgi:3-hydroxybutyrate dehydrogenase
MGELDGRVAIITGASGGVGSAICEVFTREGAQVVPVDLRGEGCFHADVASGAGTQSMVNEALERHGRLDTLVLNAGVQHLAAIDKFPEEEWDRLFNVLVKGPHLAIKAAWSHLTARPGGRIIATGSALSVVGEEYKAAYVAAKHAVVGLIKVAALEGGPLGLCANAVLPGLVWTGLMEGQLTEQMRLRGLTREQLLERIEMYQPVRASEPEEVAELMSFLASDRGSGISGTAIPVDLGFLIT